MTNEASTLSAPSRRAAPPPVLNRAMLRLLSSRLHWLVSKSLAALTYTGNVSGNRHTLVVQYVRDGDRLVVWVGRAEQKRWWRNLRTPQPVTVVLRGIERRATAQVVEATLERTKALRAYLDRYPRTREDGRPAMFGPKWVPTEEELERVAQREVFVTIELEPA